MRKTIFVSLLVTMAIFLAACGSAAAAPANTASTKQVNIKMETNPGPAVKGDVELLFNITDANGVPLENAKVDVSADHPEMAGMGMSGQATEQGGGKYSIKANFSDPGAWKLTVSVREGEIDYKEEIDLPIQ